MASNDAGSPWVPSEPNSEDIPRYIDVIEEAQEEHFRKEAALLDRREETSRLIARDLHDDIAQRLAILSTEISCAAEQLPPTITNTLQLFQNRIIETSDAIRRISHRIHPSILDDLGLEVALEALCTEFQEQHLIITSFKAGKLPLEFPRKVASCLYFVAQESLENIARHAQAKSASVLLSFDRGRVKLQVIDSGMGIEPERAGHGLGIYAMRERVRLVQGKLSIMSQRGEGSRLEVTVPI